MGALVTLDLPADAPALTLPWIITFGPLRDEEEWEPVVCGPYERSHALALAEVVVADEELMAVVEPLLTHVSVEQIRQDIAAARQAAQTGGMQAAGVGAEPIREEPTRPTPPPSVEEVRAGFARIAAKLRGRP